MRLSDNANGTFTNPVIFADYPDPDIIRVGEDFYLVSSSFTDAPGVPVCHSRDLVNWTIIGHAYARLHAGNPGYDMADGRVMYRGGSWAPSIRHHRGIFHICFNTPAEGFFMCASPRPEGPYRMTWFGGRELYDPALFFDDDDRVYVVHGCGDLYLTELTPDACAIAGPDHLLLSGSHGQPMEGSHVYKRRGYYYICSTSRGYNGIQIVHRSRELRGGYDSRVICADDMNYSGAGVHQGGFVELPGGETWFFLFQDRDYVGRVPLLLPVTWVDDWPRLGDPDNYWKLSPTSRKPALVADPPPLTTEHGDDFNNPALGLQWHWNHNPDDARWSLTARPGWLRLTAGHAPGLMNARNTLTQKVVGHGCRGTVKLDTAGLRTGDLAGLCILGFPSAFIAVSLAAGGRRLVMVNNDKLIADIDSANGGILFLRAEADREGIARFFYSTDDLAYEQLGDQLLMQFSVKSFLGNKFGLFCYNDLPHNNLPPAAAGHADFDFFRYESARSFANHLCAFDQISAADYDAEHGTDTFRPKEKQPHQFLVNLHDGDWFRFDHIDFGEGPAAFELLAAPVGQGGLIELRLDSPAGELIGTCLLPGNGEKNQWICPWLKFTCPIKPVRGPRTLCMKIIGGTGHLARLDYFTFTRSGPS
jgi:beta-xylosidase